MEIIELRLNTLTPLALAKIYKAVSSIIYADTDPDNAFINELEGYIRKLYKEKTGDLISRSLPVHEDLQML